MRYSAGRRRMLAGAGASAFLGLLDACAPRALRPAATFSLSPLHASVDRITAITVCTRPFRPQGPRIEAEQVGEKTVVHNYGHGGSGWSLSWGSSTIASDLALATGERDIGVIGCGALGLTSATLLQRAGARVTIYAKDLPPNTRSSLATGVWSPDSRICLDQHATPEFKSRWAMMARRSWQVYQTLLGLPGTPVEYYNHYNVFDEPPAPPPPDDGRPAFAHLERELTPELVIRGERYPPKTHPYGARTLISTSWMLFNLSAYQRLLVTDFVANGGRIEVAEFHQPSDFNALRQKTLINSTGYGARALFLDNSLVPVRGQTARMIPQSDIHYGLYYRGTAFVPRRDGMVFQIVGDTDYYGYGDDTTVQDRAEAERAVATIASLFA
jgi:D-amino-acid oxidase